MCIKHINKNGTTIGINVPKYFGISFLKHCAKVSQYILLWSILVSIRTWLRTNRLSQKTIPIHKVTLITLDCFLFYRLGSSFATISCNDTSWGARSTIPSSRIDRERPSIRFCITSSRFDPRFFIRNTCRVVLVIRHDVLVYYKS